jgi:Uma2 family endonuclease
MCMVQARTRWTAEMVRDIPEDRNRYEVINGDLVVSPGRSWTHQTAVELLLARLLEFLRGNRTGYLKSAPADIEFSEDTMVEPDIFVVPRGPGKVPRRWEDVQKLLLVVEVLSPSTARTDRVTKRDLYLGRGAPEYWIIDLDARLIECWRPGDSRPEIRTDSVTWQPEGAPSPFVMNLAEYFGEILDE